MREVRIAETKVCKSSLPVTVQAGLRLRKAMSAGMPEPDQADDSRCAGRTLWSSQSSRSYGYAPGSRATLASTLPYVSPEGELIMPRYGFLRYMPVFRPLGGVLRSKSVPDGLVRKAFAKGWNRRLLGRLSKMPCGFKHHVRARPSSDACGYRPAPAFVILVTHAG